MFLSLHKHLTFIRKWIMSHDLPLPWTICDNTLATAPDRLFACQANSTKVWRPSSLLWQRMVPWMVSLQILGCRQWKFQAKTASQSSSCIKSTTTPNPKDSYFDWKGPDSEGISFKLKPPNCGQMGSMYKGDVCNFKLLVKYTMIIHSHKVDSKPYLYNLTSYSLCKMMQFS